MKEERPCSSFSFCDNIILQGLKLAPLRHRLRRSFISGAESDGPAAKASCDRTTGPDR
jgi:hypothetical protein